MKQSDREYWRDMYTLASMGINLVAATFIGLGMGWAIDNKLFHGRTAPWFTLVFLLFGIVAGFRNMVSMAKKKAGTAPGPDEPPAHQTTYIKDDKDKDED